MRIEIGLGYEVSWHTGMFSRGIRWLAGFREVSIGSKLLRVSLCREVKLWREVLHKISNGLIQLIFFGLLSQLL